MRINRSGHYWVCIQIHDVNLLPTIAKKVQDGPLIPNTAQFLCNGLSQDQFADRLRFFYLIVSYSNRMQNETQKLAVNFKKTSTNSKHTILTY